MAKIVIEIPDAAATLVEKHAKELGYPHAADYAFELLRNHCAQREDALYTRMHIGEQNPVFGRSKREAADLARRQPKDPREIKDG